MKIKIPKVMISAPGSGSGKTTVVCGILKALKNRGINVSACKCGPDYIDPMFHKKVLGVQSNNIDSFFCEEDLLKNLFYEHTKESDITVIEGVMGYYDGFSMTDFNASSYDTARILKVPVILVINAKGMALTVVSVIKGIQEFKKDSNIKGIILNNVPKKVYESMKDVIKGNTGIDVFGYLPYNKEYSFESRHLGLITPYEIDGILKKTEALGKTAEECIDIDGIIKIAGDSEYIDVYDNIENRYSENATKIGIAFDDAFCFYYKDNIELLKLLGCEIVFFSPINDKKLPYGISGFIIGGGYPELYLEKLSENISMLSDIREKIKQGMPCLAECGGFMYLHKNIKDKDGKSFKMAGIIDGDAFYGGKPVRFGYITLTSDKDCFLIERGSKIKGHEFHYWDSTENGNLFLAEKPGSRIKYNCMYEYKNFVGGFPHIFYYSNTDFIKNFVKKCRENGNC